MIMQKSQSWQEWYIKWNENNDFEESVNIMKINALTFIKF